MILFSHEKGGSPDICYSVDDLEGIMLSEMLEKDKGCKISLHVESRKAELRTRE